MGKEYEAKTDSPLERVVAAAYGKANPGQAIDIAAILALVSTVFEFIRGCRSSRVKANVRSGSLPALEVSYAAVLRSGYEGNAAELAVHLWEEGGTLTDEEIERVCEEASLTVRPAA